MPKNETILCSFIFRSSRSLLLDLFLSLISLTFASSLSLLSVSLYTFVHKHAYIFNNFFYLDSHFYCKTSISLRLLCIELKIEYK